MGPDSLSRKARLRVTLIEWAQFMRFPASATPSPGRGARLSSHGGPPRLRSTPSIRRLALPAGRRPGAWRAVPGCWGAMRFIERPFCERLGIPFEQDLGAGLLSPEALADPPVFGRARAVARFDDGPARALVHRLKYCDRTELAKPIGRWMARAGASSWTTPISSSRFRCTGSGSADGGSTRPRRWRGEYRRQTASPATPARSCASKRRGARSV